MSFPGATNLSLRFSQHSEVGTFDKCSDAELKTTLQIESETLGESAPSFGFTLQEPKASRREKMQNLPGTIDNPEPFELTGTDRCSIVYHCEGLTWDKQPAIPVKAGYHWGWKCLVTATLDSPDIRDEDLASVIRLCPDLHPNKLRHHGKGPQFCLALAECREELVDLDLRLCTAITDGALACLPAGCPHLHPDRLLSDVKGDKYLTSVGNEQLDLTSIDFAACPRATDRGKLAILSGCPKITADPRVFDVMNDEMLVAIAKLRPEQSAIFHLQDFEMVTDKGLAGLLSACPKVHPDDIKSDAKGDEFLAAVGQHHKDLRKINLSRCVHVSDEALAELVTQCPYLVPDAIKTKHKGDQFVAAVARHRPALKHIDLTGCMQVTEEGLVLLVQGCPQLDPGHIRAGCKGTSRFCYFRGIRMHLLVIQASLDKNQTRHLM